MKKQQQILTLAVLSSIVFVAHADIWSDIKSKFQQAGEDIKKTAEQVGGQAQQAFSGPNVENVANQALQSMGIDVNAAVANGQTIKGVIDKIPALISQMQSEINSPSGAIVQIQSIIPHVNEFVPAIEKLVAGQDASAIFVLLNNIGTAVETGNFDAAKLGASLKPEMQQHIKTIHDFLKQVYIATSQVNQQQLFDTLATIFNEFAQLFASVARMGNNFGAIGHRFMTPELEALVNQTANYFATLKDNVRVLSGGENIDPKTIINQFIQGTMKGIMSGQLPTIINSLVATVNNSITTVKQNIGTIQQLAGSLVQLGNDLVGKVNSFGTMKNRIQSAIAGKSGVDIVTAAIQFATQEIATVIGAVKSDISGIARNAQGLVSIIHTVVDQALNVNKTLLGQLNVTVLSQPRMGAIQNIVAVLKQLIDTIGGFVNAIARQIG